MITFSLTLKNFQKINSLISDMVDAYERKHGIVEDRSIFDGEIVVPPHLRNMTLSSRPMRLHGGLLGSLSRSRTFLTLPTNSRESLHSSVPDLSRSVPTTPNATKQRMTLANSVESVLEEGEPSTRSDPLLPHINKMHKPHIYDGIELRRKSEQDIKNVRSTKSAAPVVYTTTPSHYRNNSDSLSNQNIRSSGMIPFRVQLRKPNNIIDAMTSSRSSSLQKSKNHSTQFTASLHNINTLEGLPIMPPPVSTSKWGNVRNSNSFSSDFSVDALSRYTIPRPSLNDSNGGVILKHGNNGVNDSAA